VRERIRERKTRKKNEKEREMTREGERSERDVFLFIKILDWEATVLPNVLGSTVATQAWSPKIGQLLWLVFLKLFSNFSYFRE